MGGPTTSEGELRIHQANGSLLVMSGQLTRKGLIQKDIDLCTKLRCIYSFKFMNLRVSCHYSAGVEKRGGERGREKKPHAPSSRPGKIQRSASQ